MTADISKAREHMNNLRVQYRPDSWAGKQVSAALRALDGDGGEERWEADGNMVRAWELVNSLGGWHAPTDQRAVGYHAALGDVLQIIETLGGRDPLAAGYSTRMDVLDVRLRDALNGDDTPPEAA